MKAAPTPIPAALSLVDLDRRLSAGEDPQVLLGCMVEEYLSNTSAHHTTIVGCITLLAKNGARVATGEPGCAFEDIICKADRTNSDLIENIARRLANRPGELPFHVIAKHFPILLSYNQLTAPDIQDSLRARDLQGRTICHYLWDRQGDIVGKHQAVHDAGGDLVVKYRREKDWFSCVRRAWTAQDKLQQAGIGMELPDNQGVTALDLCVERLEADDIQPLMSFDSCKQAQAYQSSRALGATTPLVDAPPSGPRF